MTGNQKAHILLITGSLFILLAVLFFSYQTMDLEKQVLTSMHFTLSVSDEEVSFSPWYENHSNLYLFLPSVFNQNSPIDSMTFSFDDRFVHLTIDDKTYHDGDALDELFDPSIPHQLCVTSLLGKQIIDAPFSILCSDKVPALLVTLETSKESFLSSSEKNQKQLGKGSLLLMDDQKVLYQSRMDEFKIRGNLTSELDKKPYTIKLPQNSPASLLGMPEAIKWNLLANATDGSYLRNKAMLDLANDSISDCHEGTFEPSAEYVEFYFNGNYEGLYLLTEAVEIAENRFSIDPEQNWFLEMEMANRASEKIPHVTTNQGQYFEIHSKSGISALDESEITATLNDVESALFSEDGISLISGKKLEELIDMESFADNWLMEEISGDHDVSIASQYVYIARNEDNKLYAGPVWDFDGTMGNVYLPRFRYPKALTASIPNVRREGTFEWMAAFYQHEAFRRVLADEYKNCFSKNLERLLSQKIPEYLSYADRSIFLDCIRWDEAKPDFVLDEPKDSYTVSSWDYPDNSFASYVQQVTDYLSSKKEFLDQIFIEGRDFCVVHTINSYPFNDHYFNQDVYYWVEKGTPIEDLLSITAEGRTQIGYFDTETGELVTNGTIIDRDRTLEGKWE